MRTSVHGRQYASHTTQRPSPEHSDLIKQPLTRVAQTADRHARLLAAEDQIGMVLRHRDADRERLESDDAAIFRWKSFKLRLMMCLYLTQIGVTCDGDSLVGCRRSNAPSISPSPTEFATIGRSDNQSKSVVRRRGRLHVKHDTVHVAAVCMCMTSQHHHLFRLHTDRSLIFHLRNRRRCDNHR